LATPRSAVELLRHVLRAALDFALVRGHGRCEARWVATGGLGPRSRRENGRPSGCLPRAAAVKGRRPCR